MDAKILPDLNDFTPLQMNDEFMLVLKHAGLEITHLNAKWEFYKKLYGTHETVALLNFISSGTFKLFQDLLFNDFVISCSKLLDPPSMGRFNNMSLEYLLKNIKDKISLSNYQEMKAILDQVSIKLEEARKLRSKVLAHSDLETAQKEHAPFNIIEAEGDEILKNIMAFLNKINHHLTRSYHIYSVGIPLPQEADKLLRMLKLAQASAGSCKYE